MTYCSSAAVGRRAVSHATSKWFNVVALIMLGLFGMAWSGQSFAQSCDFVAVSPLNQSGPAGSALTITFNAGSACTGGAGNVTGTIAITTDGTGGATAPTTFAATNGVDESFTLTLGPTPGGNGTVTVTCLAGGCAGDTLVFGFATNNQFVYTASTPVAITTNQITPFTVGTNLQINGTPGTLQTNFANVTTTTTYGQVTPNGAGTATTTQSTPIAGTYLVRGNVVCPTTFILPGCSAVPPVDFNVVVEPVSLQAISPNAVATTSGTPINLVVRYGSVSIPAPNGTNIFWTITQPAGGNGVLTGNAVAGGAGQATAGFSATVPGVYTVFATSGCTFCTPSSQTFSITVATVPTMVINGGNGQSTTVGTNFPAVLSIIAENSGLPAGGVTINWAVTTGAATITPSGPTLFTDGEAHASVTPTAAGPLTITATRADAPAVSVTFNLTAINPFTLTTSSPNPASGAIGTAMPFTVLLEQGGTPVPGALVSFTAGAPFAPGAATATTNGAGQATVNFTPSAAGTFTNVVTALYDPDGTPSSGDELQASFTATVATVPTLGIAGGNNQNALLNNPYPTALQVLALNSGTAVPGVTINWAVTGGSATLSSATSTTNGTGNSSITATAGAVAGPVTITATRQDAPAATQTFTLTVEALGTLLVVGGDDQLLAAGVASAPLQVELRNAAGTPVPGAVVSWTTSAGTLASATSTTNATGVASNTVTTTAAGAVQVSASSALTSAPAVFSLNGALASLSGLSGEQRSVAEAIDNACPALAALAAPTPAQQDLLARCRDLIDASGLDPAAAVNAIDQLMTDVAMAQGNASMSAAQSQFQNLKTRIAALRSGTNGTDFGGLAVNTSAGPISMGMLANALSADGSSTTEVGADFSRWGFFAAGTIGRGEADERDIDPAYDYDIDGITLGVDYRKSDQWIFGASLGFTSQDTDLPDERGGVETKGWSISAYSTFYQQDSWYADGVVTWGHNDFEMLRRITYTLPTPGGGTTSINQEADSDSGGDLLSTAFTVGRDFNRGALGIGPYARVLYTRLDFDSFEEDLLPGQPGSGLGLSIEERSLSSLASVLGTKFTYTHSTDWGVLMPHLSLEWEHEFKDDPQSIEARFINDPTGSAMVVRGDPLDTDYFRFGLGLSMVLTRGRSGFFYYEHLVGKDGMSNFSLALGLRLEF